jgi:hypothetical protein
VNRGAIQKLASARRCDHTAGPSAEKRGGELQILRGELQIPRGALGRFAPSCLLGMTAERRSFGAAEDAPLQSRNQPKQKSACISLGGICGDGNGFNFGADNGRPSPL